MDEDLRINTFFSFIIQGINTKKISILSISAKNKSFSIYANIQSDFSGENHGEDLSSPGVSGGYWCCRRQDGALLDEGAREFHDLDEIFGIP